jgi:hypothetical protein
MNRTFCDRCCGGGVLLGKPKLERWLGDKNKEENI